MIIFWAIQDERDQLKIESLYYQYRYLMYSEANKILHDNYLAEDAVQQACVKIIDNLHKIDEIYCPRTRNFVVIICRSVTLNILKKRLYINKKDNCIEEFEDDTRSISNDPLNIVIDQESVNRITSAIVKRQIIAN